MNREIFFLLAVSSWIGCGTQNDLLLSGASISPNLPVEKNSIDRRGYCTKSFSYGFRIVSREIKRLSGSSVGIDYDSQLEAARDACQSFFTNHSSTIDCAYLNKERELLFLSAKTIKEDCDAINYNVTDEVDESET